jgi:hypothetical protein
MSYRQKQNFTAGEVSPLMYGREDFERFKNGCKVLDNMIVRTQGPASRRSGTQFIYSIDDLGIDPNNPLVRQVEFIFNEYQAYVILFFMHVSGVVRAVFGTGEGVVTGTGEDCEYTAEEYTPFTGPASYELSYPVGATVDDIRVYHIAEDGVRTDLVLTTDYTVSYLSGVATVVVTIATLDPDGKLYGSMDIVSPAITLGDIVYLDMPIGWDISTFDFAQSGDYMYIAQSSLPVHAIVRRGVDFWEVQQITFENQPGDWSDINGWPENITFFQQRLILAANILRRQTVWASRAGDTHNFGKAGTETVDADAVTFTLDSGTQNKILWLQTVKQLHAGTVGDEWTVSGTSQRSITPGGVLSERHTNNGSERIKPLMVGLTTLFVEKFGRAVNEFVFDYTFDSFKTSDVTILAPHLTELSSIVSWAYQQTPDSIIWCVRDDGDIIALTYQRQHNVIGWHHHHTQGSFLDVCSIPGSDREDEVWIVVKRYIDGAYRYYWEKKAISFTSQDTKDCRFLDSFLTYDGIPTTSLTGLDHLEGETISILADGAVHAPKVVVGGVVTLDRLTTSVVAGLPFISEVRPLLLSVPTEEGNSASRTQRILEMGVQLKDSVGMEIGIEYSDGEERIEEQPFRKPSDITGASLPLFNGWYPISFFEGYDNKSEYFIRQRLPLPLTVVAVVDKVEVN